MVRRCCELRLALIVVVIVVQCNTAVAQNETTTDMMSGSGDFTTMFDTPSASTAMIVPSITISMTSLVTNITPSPSVESTAEFATTTVVLLTSTSIVTVSSIPSPIPTAPPIPVCGNGVREGYEECDDGNSDEVDGCASNCTLVYQEDFVCNETTDSRTECQPRDAPIILDINDQNQINIIPNVVIFDINNPQFIVDQLNVTVRRSVLNNDSQELLVQLVNDSSISEIRFDVTTALLIGRIATRPQLSILGSSPLIRVTDLINVSSTNLALELLAYRYVRLNTFEHATNTTPALISVMLLQGDISSTANFTVQYRGENLAAPVLDYTPDGNVTYTLGDAPVDITSGALTITDIDHPTYLLQSARVEIVTYNGNEYLALNTPPPVNVNYSSGVLSITGNASISIYAGIINNILYSNNASEPMAAVKEIFRISVTDSPLFDDNASPLSNSIEICIYLLPPPPNVTITVEDLTFTEGQNYLLLRDSTAFIRVVQHQDVPFLSIRISLQIRGDANRKLAETELLSTIIPPGDVEMNISETSDVHVVEFTGLTENGISDVVATLAIRSIVYINFEREPLAFDDTGAPVFREILISTMDMLSRSFETNFSIEVLPVNDNPPVIRLFTVENCSNNSVAPSPRRRRGASPQRLQKVKRHSDVLKEHQMVPLITEIHGALTDKHCAAYIAVHFSAAVSHPYVDIWPRMSLVLSLAPQYLSDLQPTGIWDGPDILIVAFPEHNCSEWNYNDSRVTFEESDDPCHSPIECITGVCYSNYTGCRITGTFAFNFTTDHDNLLGIDDCLYPPTSPTLLADTWVVNILVATVVILSAVISFYLIHKCASKRSSPSSTTSPQDRDVVKGTPRQSFQSKKQKRRKSSNKPSTIARLALTPVAKQQADDVPRTNQSQSDDHYHGNDDYTFLLLDKDDDGFPIERSRVEEVGSNPKDITTSLPDVTEDTDHTSSTQTVASGAHPHDNAHMKTADTPRRLTTTDSAFMLDNS